jgi:acyl-CoA synthetase (NDP forming)
MAEGGELAELSAETIESLNQFLSPHWSRGNPVRLRRIAKHARNRLARVCEIVIAFPGAEPSIRQRSITRLRMQSKEPVTLVTTRCDREAASPPVAPGDLPLRPEKNGT